MWTQSSLSGCNFCNYEQTMQKLKRDVPTLLSNRRSAHSQTNNLVKKSYLRSRWNCCFGGQIVWTWNNTLHTKPSAMPIIFPFWRFFKLFIKSTLKTFAFQISKGKKWNSRGLVSSCLKSVWFGGDPYFFMWNTNDWSHCTIDPERDRTVFDAKNVTKYWRARRSLNFQSIVQCFTFSSLN